MSKEKKNCCCRSAIYSSLLLLVCGTILFTAGSKCLAQSASSALAADWLESTTPDVSPSEAALLKRSQASLMSDVITGDAWKPYRSVMPSLGSYRGILNWDSAFHAANWPRKCLPTFSTGYRPIAPASANATIPGPAKARMQRVWDGPLHSPSPLSLIGTMTT
jgi:hypothetical protein